MLTDEFSKIGTPAPPTGGSRPAEQTIETGQVAAGCHRDELTELGSQIADHLFAINGTCRPEEAATIAYARAGTDTQTGRAALSAAVGVLNAALFPVTLANHRPLPSLDEVPA